MGDKEVAVSVLTLTPERTGDKTRTHSVPRESISAITRGVLISNQKNSQLILWQENNTPCYKDLFILLLFV